MPDFLEAAWQAVDGGPWPFVVLVIALAIIFRHELAPLIRRLEHVKGWGFEASFREALNQLPEKVAKAADDVAALPADHSLTGSATVEVTTGEAPLSGQGLLEVDATVDVRHEGRREDTDASVAQILSEAASDPGVALIHLSSLIEDELQQVLGSAGFLAGRRYLPIPAALETLRNEYKILPPSVVDALATFWRVRNHIMHQGDINRDDALRALDSGLIMYKTLRALPIATRIVYHPGTEVYRDAAGKHPRADVKAVILEEISAGGALKHRHVLPTQQSHFAKGMHVAWEFGHAPVWGESWYRDPDTGEITYAWTEAVEFIGRDLNEFGRTS